MSEIAHHKPVWNLVAAACIAKIGWVERLGQNGIACRVAGYLSGSERLW